MQKPRRVHSPFPTRVLTTAKKPLQTVRSEPSTPQKLHTHTTYTRMHTKGSSERKQEGSFPAKNKSGRGQTKIFSNWFTFARRRTESLSPCLAYVRRPSSNWIQNLTNALDLLVYETGKWQAQKFRWKRLVFLMNRCTIKQEHLRKWYAANKKYIHVCV